MMRTIKIFTIALSLLMFSNVLFGDVKIVYCNIDRVIAEYKMGKSLKNQLDKIHKSNLESFSKTEKNLKDEETKLLAKKKILSKEEFQKEFNLIRDKAFKYQNKRTDLINDVSAKRVNATKKAIELMNPILAKYADENDISIIIPKQNIIIGKTQLDISADILKIVDKEIKPFKIN